MGDKKFDLNQVLQDGRRLDPSGREWLPDGKSMVGVQRPGVIGEKPLPVRTMPVTK